MKYTVRIICDCQILDTVKYHHNEYLCLPRIGELIYLEDTKEAGVLKAYEVVRVYHQWEYRLGNTQIEIYVQKWGF